MADRVLSDEQRSALRAVRHRVGNEPREARVLSEDVILGAELRAWIAHVEARRGRVSTEDLKRLAQLRQASRGRASYRDVDEVSASMSGSCSGARGVRVESARALLVIGLAQFVAITALHRFAFRHAWGDAVGMGAAFAGTWVLLQAAFGYLVAKRRGRDV